MSIAKAIVCPPADSQSPASALTPMSVPVLARQRSWAAVPRMRLRIVPVRPATAREPSKAPAASWPCMASSRCTTWRGVVRSERESPEPSTICGVRPSSASWLLTTPTPAAVVPAPPNSAPRSLTSISARKLSEGTFVRRMRSRIGGEGAVASSCASAGAVPAPLRPSTRIPSVRRALANCPAASAAGLPSFEKPRLSVSAPSTPPMSRS